MISLEDALARIVAEARPLGTEQIGLGAAHDRVLAVDLAARGDAPRAAVSAMDGYAVRDADIGALPATLPVAARVFAGAADAVPLEPGTCARVFTGAPVPPNADRVVIQELVRTDDGQAVFETQPGEGRHIRKSGSDFRRGDILLEAGARLTARAMVAAAAADHETILVYRLPSVVILGTGDELAEPGQAFETPGAIAESVSFGVSGLAREWGGEVTGRRRLPDDPEALKDAAHAALSDADVVVVTGGASVGERDYARDMFASPDLEMIFSKVAIKPGKPVWFARVGAKKILGLPGNPTSAMVTARLLLAPLIAGLSGRNPAEALAWRAAIAGAALGPVGDRETLERGRIENGVAVRLRDQDSGAQRALAQADVLIRRSPGDGAVATGEQVVVLDF